MSHEVKYHIKTKYSLGGKTLIEKILTSLESCLFTEVLYREGRASVGILVLLLWLCIARTGYNIVYVQCSGKKCFENYIVRSHVFQLIADAQEGCYFSRILPG